MKVDSEQYLLLEKGLRISAKPNLPVLNVFPEHCALLGYVHVPDPPNALQSSSVNSQVPHDSGQHLLKSRPHQ